jgi:hypothetical protein
MVSPWARSWRTLRRGLWELQGPAESVPLGTLHSEGVSGALADQASFELGEGRHHVGHHLALNRLSQPVVSLLGQPGVGPKSPVKHPGFQGGAGKDCHSEG